MAGKKERIQANICAGETLEIITSEAWMMLLSKEDKRRSSRLELACWKSVTARVEHWTLTDSNQKEETGQARKRRMNNPHTDSPSKKIRGKQGTTSIKEAHENIENIEISNHQETNLPQIAKVHSGTVKHASTGVGGNPKKNQLQVKTRKWVRKKNGLFGWVTSIAKESGKPQEIAHGEILNGGVGKIQKEHSRQSGGRMEKVLKAAQLIYAGN